jgi:hypothetical protein
MPTASAFVDSDTLNLGGKEEEEGGAKLRDEEGNF